jgi:hypothetical protein
MHNRLTIKTILFALKAHIFLHFDTISELNAGDDLGNHFGDFEPRLPVNRQAVA